MRTKVNFKKAEILVFLSVYLVTIILPATNVWALDSIVYPIKQMSKLECRYENFNDLSSDCKQDLPILNTKNYKKLATQDWGFNLYTRIYSVLWWSSYKYWWDVWNGWHTWTDIATAKWTPVYSIATWEVIIAKSLSGFWNTITVRHFINWKNIYSNYSHLSKILVNKWDKVRAWNKIWEVWSTWNSTWNHLHFQIDLDTPFHPYYYDKKACPYGSSQITEEWICFWELKNNTVDPILFLETRGDILNNIKITTVSRDEIDSNTNSVEKVTKTNEVNEISIFNKTVYVWYPEEDIKKVQEIFRDLGEYNWAISW
jgi:hypothetical protein